MGNINILVGKCGDYSQSFKKNKKNVGKNKCLLQENIIIY